MTEVAKPIPINLQLKPTRVLFVSRRPDGCKAYPNKPATETSCCDSRGRAHAVAKPIPINLQLKPAEAGAFAANLMVAKPIPINLQLKPGSTG